MMLSNEATKALVIRAKQGEADAFEALARAYLRAAYAVALAIVQRPADAEDLAQDALLLAFERINTCREPACFGGWLLQIARNKSRNWLRSRRQSDVPREDNLAEQTGDLWTPDRTAHRLSLLRAMHALKPVEREIVLLHDLEGWTHPEIAASLEISVLMSRQHLFQGRRKLRTELDGQSPTGEKSWMRGK